MQEEIEQKSFNLMISTTKLSARTVLRAVKAAIRLYQSKASQGKQSVRTLVFFKAPDAEAFNSAFKEYSASLLNKDKRPSVLARLHELVQAAAELPGKVRHKEQERGL